jgi:hypothetical protein
MSTAGAGEEMRVEKAPESRPVIRILPEIMRHPGWLLLSSALPCGLLLAVNGYLLDPVWGEMNPSQHGRAVLWLSMLGILVALQAGIALRWMACCRPVRLPESVVLGVLAIGYLWTSIAWLAPWEGIVPLSVQSWILPPENLIGMQFLLGTPAVFHGLFRMACFESRSRAMASPAAALGVLLLIPLGMTGFFMGFSMIIGVFGRWLPNIHMWRGWEEAFMWGLLLLLLSTTLVALAALVRVGTMAYGWMQGFSPVLRTAFLLTVTVLCPLGGLLLNITVPFPTDFQNPVIYGLAVVNGLVLSLPFRRGSGWDHARWLAACVMFPFSLYFFLIFLPWMPLAMPAMLAMGVGFLILTPIMLFSVHLQEILQGWQQRCDGPFRVAPGMGACMAMLVLPGWIVAEACMDRAALHEALDLAYRQPYGERVPEGFDQKRAGRTLERMRDMQAGMYLPLLSEFYKQVVFDGMVLPQARLKQLGGFFSTKPFEEKRVGIYRGMFAQDAVLQQRQMVNPYTTDTVHVAAATARTTATDGLAPWRKVEVDVSLENKSYRAAEYRGRLILPEGTLLTGFELQMNGAYVPARIFEKKTALWVYQKIRDREYMRDPGMACYGKGGVIEVNVFPFLRPETRRVRLQLLVPPLVSGVARLDDVPIPLGVEKETRLPVAVRCGGGTALVLPPDLKLPQVQGDRYLHFIVDRGENGPDLAEVKELMRRAEKELGMPGGRITEANFDWFDHPKGEALQTLQLPARGGFCFERAVANELAKRQADLARGTEFEGTKAGLPLYVAITKGEGRLIFDGRSAPFADGVGNMDAYGVVTADEGARLKDWSEHKPAALSAPGRMVWIRCGDVVKGVTPGKQGEWVLFPGAKADAGPQFWNGRGWEEMKVETCEAGPVKNAVAAWLAAERVAREPQNEEALFAEALKASREASVLTPVTSFMVVENSAQWKMLDRKEKQKLGAAKEFEFEDEAASTPEPATWALVLLGLLIFLARPLRHRMDWLKRMLTKSVRLPSTPAGP